MDCRKYEPSCSKSQPENISRGTAADIGFKGNPAPCLNGYTPAPCRVQTGRKRLGNYPFFSGNLEFQESGLMMWKVGRVGRRKKGRVGRVGIKVPRFL